ncbi:MAG: caspase family protein [Coleofasciculaceae cyanobacterium]
MAKVALLIGVSEYGPGLKQLPAALKNIEVMQQVLQHKNMGGFDEVKTLANPNPPLMREAIEAFVSEHTDQDLALLFFSGHSIINNRGELYFATSITPKSLKEELIRVTAFPASLVNELINKSPCKQQVVILDFCLDSELAEEIKTQDSSKIDIKDQLGCEGRAILACSDALEYSLQQIEASPSIYTRYLIEGIETGAADQDGDNWISVQDLHKYVSRKLRETAPAIQPEFYSNETENKILLAKVQIDNPKLKYRREVENWVSGGDISSVGRNILDSLAKSWQLTSQDCTAIEAEVLRPYQKYQDNLQRYEQEYKKVLAKSNVTDSQDVEDIKQIRQFLGLRAEDVASIEEALKQSLATELSLQEHVQATEEKSLQATVSQSSPEKNLFQPPTSHSLPPDISHNRSNPLHITPTNDAEIAPEETQIPSNEQENLNYDPAPVPFFKKHQSLMAIGGGLSFLALGFAIFSQTLVKSPEASTELVPSSSEPLPISSVEQTDNTETEIGSNPSPSPSPTPSPSPAPESNTCSISVNGNVRSEPTSEEYNVVTSVEAELPVTGKRTGDGWIQVKMPSYQLAWVHPQVIASNLEELDTCLANQGRTTRIVDR